MMKYLQKLGKALMLPVAVLPICGILMGLGYALAPGVMGDITLLEEIAVRWRIEIQPTQVPPEEWKTVRSIARMLEKKMVEKTS